jgi:hypothetical protein
MPSDYDKKKSTDGDMATTTATMQDTILKKMDEGFASLEKRIKALEEKAICDGHVMNQQTSSHSPHLVLQRLSRPRSLQTQSPP